MQGKGVGRGVTRIGRAAGVAMCCLSVLGLASTGDVSQADSATAVSAGSSIGVLEGSRLDRQLHKILPGKPTKAQVIAVLGRPWRTVQYNDLDEIENEIWEYRGISAQGSFRVHIEFDRKGVAQIVGKIPESGGRSLGMPPDPVSGAGEGFMPLGWRQAVDSPTQLSVFVLQTPNLSPSNSGNSFLGKRTTKSACRSVHRPGGQHVHTKRVAIRHRCRARRRACASHAWRTWECSGRGSCGPSMRRRSAEWHGFMPQ